MYTYPKLYDVIVVGAGHAGCEAALAAAKMGCETLLLTITLDTIAQMSCNPAVGGLAKGHMAREIDALGGVMGKVIDATGIQFRMLNRGKGPAVWAPRAQADKKAYQLKMKHILEEAERLDLKQALVEDICVEDGRITGVVTQTNTMFPARTVIITTGTFLRGLPVTVEAHPAPGFRFEGWREPGLGAAPTLRLVPEGKTRPLLPAGSPWKYSDHGRDLETRWREPLYPPEWFWREGPAPVEATP